MSIALMIILVGRLRSRATLLWWKSEKVQKDLQGLQRVHELILYDNSTGLRWG